MLISGRAKTFLNLSALFLILLTLSGCDQSNKALLSEDETNPNIARAMAAQRDRNYAEAAKGYEAALIATPSLSRPHFELGLLYADRLNDPIAALYHFQTYLKEHPAGENSESAGKRLDSLKIAFAATVPNSPIQNAEAFAKLQADNQSLLRELEETKDKVKETASRLSATQTELSKSSVALTPTAVAQNVVKDSPDPKVELPVGVDSNIAPVSPVSPREEVSPVTSPTTPPATPTEIPKAVAVTPVPPVETTSSSDRVHTVASGETLWSISKKYYPGQVNLGIEKIRKANVDKLPEGKPLKIGTVLAIP